MYTGIVQATGKVRQIVEKENLRHFEIEVPPHLTNGLALGASVGVDGVCLTVVEYSPESISFDVMKTTLELTTLGALQIGDLVNIERSARQGDEIGGHTVSGHVDGMARVVDLKREENLHWVTYQVPAEKMPYLFEKGFVALNGCSLTVAAIDRSACRISVSFIPETLRITTHGIKQVGDWVNLEIDRNTQVIVDTVTRLLKENPGLVLTE